MNRRPTILDVAREAGVSKSTVSLVVQGSPAPRAETRARVEAAMARLGYVRNRAAAQLRGADTGLIGLVINDLRNPFFTEFAASLQGALAGAGYAAVIANTDEDPDEQDRVTAAMLEHGVAALVLCPTHDTRPETAARLDRAGIPAMQVLRRMDRDGAALPFASFDYRAGGEAATRHLIGTGARRIVFAGGLEGRQITRERMGGYDAAMRGAGLGTRSIPGRPSRALGRAIALRLAAETPRADAALCFSDLVALGMLSGFAEAGITVGRDIRIVGFDDIEEASLCHPRLSSVRCDIGGFGRDVAATLLRWLSDGLRPPDETRTPVTLIPRASSTGR
ncbi:LacI family DNA-binding transcriptional regulator [Citreimonas salinaria]|uniref:Transcriptional regulator, LacI family n=1 Tax=Citreimonas salinaria TaxID=321339 RepID=A0A1H3J9M5_9RHOB|nr:LacI family DNA-binding transcriptional regulator [Citreimonas salinaria]SDY36616.1 transcriptional regulator, LacI family [Citreimonas salinaria]